MQRHSVDVFSLIAGVIALGIALLMLTGFMVGFTVNSAIVLPVAVAMAGATGLVATVIRHRGSPVSSWSGEASPEVSAYTDNPRSAAASSKAADGS